MNKQISISKKQFSKMFARQLRLRLFTFIFAIGGGIGFYFAWTWFIAQSNPDGFIWSIGKFVTLIGLIVLSVVDLVLLVMPFSEDF